MGVRGEGGGRWKAEASDRRLHSHALQVLQDLQDGPENGCGGHCPGVRLVELHGTDIAGSPSSRRHVLGGLGRSFCALRGTERSRVGDKPPASFLPWKQGLGLGEALDPPSRSARTSVPSQGRGVTSPLLRTCRVQLPSRALFSL